MTIQSEGCTPRRSEALSYIIGSVNLHEYILIKIIRRNRL